MTGEFGESREGSGALRMVRRNDFTAASYSHGVRELLVAAGHRLRLMRWAVAAVDSFLPTKATAVVDEG